MKIVVTGSLGHISKPLAQELIQKKHTVTVISSKPEKQQDIEALGAKAAIGTIEDPAFLAATFQGADSVYCMEPPFSFFDKELDVAAHIDHIGHAYAEAIRQSGVKRVVHLSSIGAHTDTGNGMLALHYKIERILNELPSDVAITFLRPVGFYYNLYGFLQTIKTQGTIVTNYGDLREPWVSPLDIASAAAEEMELPFTDRKVRYVASEELSCEEVAHTLGTAIGKPDLKWVVISDEQLLEGLLAAGMNPAIAKGYVEMNAGRRSGVLYEDYYRHRPVLGKVKLADFAKEFAAVYQAN